MSLLGLLVGQPPPTNTNNTANTGANQNTNTQNTTDQTNTTEQTNGTEDANTQNTNAENTTTTYNNGTTNGQTTGSTTSTGSTNSGGSTSNVVAFSDSNSVPTATSESVVAAKLQIAESVEPQGDEESARMLALAAHEAYRSQAVIDRLLVGPSEISVTALLEAKEPTDEKGALAQDSAAANPLDKPAEAPYQPKQTSEAA